MILSRMKLGKLLIDNMAAYVPDAVTHHGCEARGLADAWRPLKTWRRCAGTKPDRLALCQQRENVGTYRPDVALFDNTKRRYPRHALGRSDRLPMARIRSPLARVKEIAKPSPDHAGRRFFLIFNKLENITGSASGVADGFQNHRQSEGSIPSAGVVTGPRSGADLQKGRNFQIRKSTSQKVQK